MHSHSAIPRAARIIAAAVSIALVACNDAPTEPTDFPGSVTPPPPPPPAAPAPPPAPPAPPSTAPWQGFLLREVGSDDPSGSGPTYSVIPITGPSTATGTYPHAINDAGQVVGGVAHGEVQHAFIWSREDGMKDLGVLPGGTYSVAKAINRHGEVVGYSVTGDLIARSFRWTPETGMVDLGVSPGCVSFYASGINSDGDIVGRCLRDRASTVYRPFRWTKSRGIEDLGTYFGDKEGGASAINDRGDIVGFSSRESYYDDSRAVLWTRVGNAVQLGNCGQDGCSANGAAINSLGDIAGSFQGYSVLWYVGGSFLQLGPGTDSEHGTATGINDRWQIVGVIYPPDGPAPIRAYTWIPQIGVVPILGLPAATETVVSGINNNGDIVGYSR